jgi:hypothetical protein
VWLSVRYNSTSKQFAACHVIVFSNSLPIVEGNLSRDRLLLIDTSRLPPEFLQLGPLPPHQNPEQACTPRLFDWAYRASSDPDIVSGGAFTSPSGSAPTPQAAPQTMPGTDNFSLGIGNSEGNGPTGNKSESSISEQAAACAHHGDGLEDDWEALLDAHLDASPPRHGNELSGDTGIASQPPSPCCDALQGVSCSLPESMSMAQLGSSATDNGSSWSQEVDLELALTTDNTSCESSLLSPNSDVSLGTLQNMVAGMPNGSCNTTNLGNTMAADRAPATAQTLDSQTHGQQPPSDLQPEKRPKRKRVVKAFPVVGTAGNPGMSRSLRTRKT